ncbi:MAG: hypothetical protein ACE5KQ_00260 [Thermoplasmata archaeon]
MSFLDVETWDRIRIANQVLQTLWDYLESRGENVDQPQGDPGLAGALYWVGQCRREREEGIVTEKLDGVIWNPSQGGWVCERHLVSPDRSTDAN